MARGAHEPDRHALERGAGRGQQEIGAGRTEPDHDDARLRRHAPWRLRRSGRRAGGAAVVGTVVVPSRAVLGVGALGGVTSYTLWPWPFGVQPHVPNRGSTCTLNAFSSASIALLRGAPSPAARAPAAPARATPA